MALSKRHRDKFIGHVYNLRTLYRRLNGLYFNGEVKARIEWGRARGLKARRSREFGTYYYKEKRIRIHPVLDQGWVPIYVVESVLHHEMCHQVCPEVIKGKRRFAHTKDFRNREREYVYYFEAERWLRENFRRLLKPSPVLRLPTPDRESTPQLQLAFAS